MANSSSTDSNSILVINTPTYYIKFSVNQLGENNSCVKVEKISVRKNTILLSMWSISWRVFRSNNHFSPTLKKMIKMKKNFKKTKINGDKKAILKSKNLIASPMDNDDNVCTNKIIKHIRKSQGNRTLRQKSKQSSSYTKISPSVGMEMDCISWLKIKQIKKDIKKDKNRKWGILHKNRNKIKKMENGNIRNSIKILSWNKGSSLIKNSIEDLRDMVNDYKPEVFILNEFNLLSGEDPAIAKIHGYRLEIDKIGESTKQHRTAIYVKENINYERMYQYENKLSSTVCLKVGYKGMKKIYICGYYRQFTIEYNDEHKKEMSKRPIEAMKRFEDQLNIWEKLIEDKKNNEIYIAGDFNVDSIAIKKEEKNKTDYDKTFTKPGKIIDEKLTQNGLHRVNSLPTHYGRSLDHIYTNRPDKLFKIDQIDETESDHSALLYHRHMKINLCEPSFVLSRDFNAIDFDIVNNDIMKDENYIKALEEENPNTLCD